MSHPLLNRRNDEATPTVSLHEKAHLVNALNTYTSSFDSESGMDNLFLKNVYCLSGLGIVRKNRSMPKHFDSKKVFDLR